MSTLHRPTTVEQATAASVAVAWPVAPHALEPWLREHAGGRADSSVRSRAVRSASLRVIVGDARCRVELDIAGTLVPVPVNQDRLRIQRRSTAGFTHTDVSVTGSAHEPGLRVLSLTVQPRDGGAVLLYAATDLLRQLGVPGGRYGRPVLDSSD